MDGNGGVVNATAGQCASACEISIECNTFEYNPALRACSLRQNASWPTVHLPEEGWQTFWHAGMTFPVPQPEAVVVWKDLPDTLGEYKSDQERLARLEQKLDGVVSNDNKWIGDPTGLKGDPPPGGDYFLVNELNRDETGTKVLNDKPYRMQLESYPSKIIPGFLVETISCPYEELGYRIIGYVNSGTRTEKGLGMVGRVDPSFIKESFNKYHKIVPYNFLYVCCKD